MESLREFIRSNPDPRELKRALAVKMVKQNYSYYQIRDTLGVSVGFISNYQQKFEREGIEGLKLQYQGSQGYLTPAQRQEVIDWLKEKDYWQLSELKTHIEVTYSVVFASLQSYYSLFSEAGISWKKTQKSNPRKDPDLVKKKKIEIETWLLAHRQEILSGKLKVFFQDECHLLWGDICGYIWGRTDERITVPITNEKQKQTYYGAIDLQTNQMLVQPYQKGESQFTIAFLKYLQAEYPQSRIAVIWDGASYHRSGEVQGYLASVNQGLEPDQWPITCIRFAPNAPEQNPIEDVWLSAKRFVREFYSLCGSFSVVKRLFELATHEQIFDFPKLSLYSSFS